MFRYLPLACAAASLALTAQMPVSMSMPMAAPNATPFIAAQLQHAGSGTSGEPNSTPTPMLMTTGRGWSLMLHGQAFIASQQQTGPRGFDKLFSTNWVMGMAQRSWGPGQLTLRAMLSLEPATITDRQYPELFQTGETAFGRAIVDGQHPHNFFMELAALYDLRPAPNLLLTVYAAPMGDPAIGPVAFPHRASAADDPLAPLGHHLEDSTHIAAGVVTVAATYRDLRLEGSAFHGREPNEHRWTIPIGGLDSYSWRLTLNPAAAWSSQYSWAHIKSPEALNPALDQIRMTASLMYNRRLWMQLGDATSRAGIPCCQAKPAHKRPTGATQQKVASHARGNWANTLLWGRTRNVGGGHVLNGYLAESDLGVARNHFWTRIENVDKSNDLVLGESPQPPGFEERFLGRVQAFSWGYSRDLPAPRWSTLTLGAQWTLYHTPAALQTIYGAHPSGLAMYLRLGLGSTR
ncbi:MAG TPA: hypothetical protein VIC54_01985 [Terriglobales bacterium]|jgi:hypothetical protein